MSNMTFLITAILAVSGLAALLQAVNHMTRSSVYSYVNIVLIDVVVILLYLMTAGLVVVFTVYSGYNPLVIYTSLALVVLALAVFFIKIYLSHPRSTNYHMLILFAVYFALVAYLTIFMRIGSVETSVVTTPFDDIKQAFVRHDPEMVAHFFLNVLLFVPFGFLIPATNPKYMRKMSFAMMGGLVASSVIEGCQMIFQLGQSDVDDIIANTLGAVLGYAMVRFVWQFQKNWRLG